MLAAVTAAFGDMKGFNLEIPKIHAFSHHTQNVGLFGSTYNYHGAPTEALHKGSKSANNIAAKGVGRDSSTMRIIQRSLISARVVRAVMLIPSFHDLPPTALSR